MENSPMKIDSYIEKAASEFTARHGAHTIFLYGSRADGTYGNDSDYDFAAFAAIDTTIRIARWDDGRYLDAFIYPEVVLQEPTKEHLSLIGAKIVLQRERSGEEFLNALDDIYKRGPTRKSDEDIEVLKVWAHKMAMRIERGDVEGHYRRSWLLTALLEDYFHINGIWWEGPKKALRWLEKNDSATYQHFVAALNPGASNIAIVGLVERVTGRNHAKLTST
jgi:predicted nucleotidyltransferase